MKSSTPRRGLRFDRGFWRYFCPCKGVEIIISGLIRRERYHPCKVAAALGISLRSLERTVRESLDTSARTWLRLERVVMARSRLREGASVKEVACELDFAHQTDLCNEFRKLQGITPSKYRKIARDHQNPDLWGPPESD